MSIDDFEYNPFYEYPVRMEGLPAGLREELKLARKKANAAGGKIPIIKLIVGRGQAFYVVSCRDFNDSRRFDRLHRDWVEDSLKFRRK